MGNQQPSFSSNKRDEKKVQRLSLTGVGHDKLIPFMSEAPCILTTG